MYFNDAFFPDKVEGGGGVREGVDEENLPSLQTPDLVTYRPILSRNRITS